jgi:4,5-DOPA dioxygenase extradiol
MTDLMPAAFLGHGSPMNALERNRYTDTWRAFGARVPKPRAILVISAHWFINATAVTAMANPRTIHDFYGFPPALFAVNYPAPGASGVADEVIEAVRPDQAGRDEDSWGLDHGTWSLLVHAFPKADIPVLQLSINALKSFDHHLELGARLAGLRQRGVLILGSGNVVHNLGLIDWRQPDAAFDWNARFDARAQVIMTQAPAEAPALQSHADFARAVPTPEHFLPLLYIAGLAAAANEPAEILIEGFAMGSLSMTAYTLGMTAAIAPTGGKGAPVVENVPGDESNL